MSSFTPIRMLRMSTLPKVVFVLGGPGAGKGKKLGHDFSPSSNSKTIAKVPSLILIQNRSTTEAIILGA